MMNLPIDWDSVPDVMNKDQFYRLCHISKSTALHLLKSGKVPCEWTGKKTRCYKIKKEDVKAYLEERDVYPELYSAPAGWYKGNYTVKMSAEVPEQTLENMKLYYTELFAQYPDVLTATDISKVIGYGTTSINDWCKKGHLKAFKRNNVNHIPKVYLIEFCCSKYFRTITRKSEWHIRVLREFPRWQVIYSMKVAENDR